MRSLAGTCVSEPSPFEQYDAYVQEQAEDETLAERIDEILSPALAESEASSQASVSESDATRETHPRALAEPGAVAEA